MKNTHHHRDHTTTHRTPCIHLSNSHCTVFTKACLPRRHQCEPLARCNQTHLAKLWLCHGRRWRRCSRLSVGVRAWVTWCRNVRSRDFSAPYCIHNKSKQTEFRLCCFNYIRYCTVGVDKRVYAVVQYKLMVYGHFITRQLITGQLITDI